MKNKLFIIVMTLVALAFVFLPALLFAQTNAPNEALEQIGDAVPATFGPLLELLGGRGTFITTIIAWFSAISILLAPFAVWIRNKLADMVNRVAETKDDITDDAYLIRIFSNPIYKFLAFVLNFANVRLPTLAELERAIALQKEAVQDAREGRLT